jgi:hypothetical protein
MTDQTPEEIESMDRLRRESQREQKEIRALYTYLDTIVSLLYGPQGLRLENRQEDGSIVSVAVMNGKGVRAQQSVRGSSPAQFVREVMETVWRAAE